MLVKQLADYMRQEAAKVIVGQEDTWTQLVVALLSGGHVLQNLGPFGAGRV